MRHPTRASIEQSEVVVYAEHWRIALEAKHAPRTTINTYLLALRQFDEYLSSMGMPRVLAAITPEHVREWQRDLLGRCAPATVRLRHAALRAFFEWVITEGEVKENPLRSVQAPALADAPARVLNLEELAALVAACERDDSFEGKRDAALVRFFIDTGCRMAEVLGIKHDAVDLKTGIVSVMGKGRRPRLVHLRPRTLNALARYLRRRAFHPYANAEQLWIGHKGPLGASGVGQIIKKRARMAGLGDDVHAHLLRHSFADQWLRNGGSEGDLMTLGGWRSAAVMRRYAAGVAVDRAIEAHAQMEEKL
jgi:site-specific recombinase XerD